MFNDKMKKKLNFCDIWIMIFQFFWVVAFFCPKQKTKECVNFLAQKVVAVTKEIWAMSLVREFLKQNLTEKQNVFLQIKWPVMGGGCLQQMPSLREGWLYVTQVPHNHHFFFQEALYWIHHLGFLQNLRKHFQNSLKSNQTNN